MVAVGEALGMRAVRRVECGLSDGGDLADTAVEDVGRREQGQSSVMVVVLAPGEEIAQPGAAVELAGKAAAPNRIGTSWSFARAAGWQHEHGGWRLAAGLRPELGGDGEPQLERLRRRPILAIEVNPSRIDEAAVPIRAEPASVFARARTPPPRSSAR